MAFCGTSAPLTAAPLVAAAPPFPTTMVSTNGGCRSRSSNSNNRNNSSSSNNNAPAYNASINTSDLVSGILRLYQSANVAPSIRLLSTDKLFPLTKRFVALRHDFRAAGKPVHVHVGFHYTDQSNLDSIRVKGLVCSAPGKHGTSFGRGIYIGGNPRAFCPYGEIGIIVLYIRGIEYNMASYQDSAEIADAWIGNKLMNGVHDGCTSMTFPKSPYFDETVVRTAEQILPLFIYSRATINKAELLFQLHAALQRFADQIWNQRPTQVVRILPSPEDLVWESKLRARCKYHKIMVWGETDELVAKDKMKPETVHCPGYHVLRKEAKHNRKEAYSFHTKTACPVDCPICMESTIEFVQLKKCRHFFHKKCIDKSRKVSNQCPICRVPLGEPFGKCPKGTMTIQYDDSLFVNGAKGFYDITYYIPHGVQNVGHETPGAPFTGTRRKAYLPSNCVDTLQRLRYAFCRGLTFTIGTSLTSGRTNTIVWASIPHKSSLTAGVYGFPDAKYLLNVNKEMDALGIPQAADLHF